MCRHRPSPGGSPKPHWAHLVRAPGGRAHQWRTDTCSPLARLPVNLSISLNANLQCPFLLGRAWRSFLERLLTDWEIRTLDPEEANLFYVPSLSFTYTHNGGASPAPAGSAATHGAHAHAYDIPHRTAHLPGSAARMRPPNVRLRASPAPCPGAPGRYVQRIVDFLKAEHPHIWERHQGRDHIFMALGAWR